MSVELINPDTLGNAVGYSHAAVGRGAYIALAGQIGWNKDLHLVSDDFLEQFEQALSNLVTALKAAGGQPVDVVSIRMYCTDKVLYWDRKAHIGDVYRKYMGRHYPPMVMVEVKSLIEPGALIEIEGVAIVSDRA
jgi:enamine deaminase RidA (YjgF/YER057c/UK114 family)